METSYNLLYIDDEPENLTVFSSKFRRIFNVFTASSASEGLELLNKHEIQLVISDHRMPEMTGVELLEEVKGKYPDVVRIILTAYTDSEDIINAINKGGVYYFIKKPWVGDEVKALIDKGLSYYNLRQRNKNLIQRLYTSINELEMFYYRISHDLRGPVASQYGILNLAKSEKDFNHMNEYLDMLEESIRKLDGTLKKIADVGRTGDHKSPMTRIDFDSVIDATLFQLKAEIEAKGIQVSVTVQPNITYHAVEPILATLLENILENSIYFSDERKGQKTLTISVKADDKKVNLDIEDNGVGIHESQLGTIFDAFYRGSAISKGNGLGLYVVKKAVDSLRGQITVSSQEGIGTTVHVELPCLDPNVELEENLA